MNAVIKVPVELDDLSLDIKIDPTATANRGLIAVGSGPFDGAATGHFVGAATGTYFSINAPSGYAGDFSHYQLAGVTQYRVNRHGAIKSPSLVVGDAGDMAGADVGGFAAIAGATGFGWMNLRCTAAQYFVYSDQQVVWMTDPFYFANDVDNGTPYAQMQRNYTLATNPGGIPSALRSVIAGVPISLNGRGPNDGTAVPVRLIWEVNSAAPNAATKHTSWGYSGAGTPPTWNEIAYMLVTGQFAPKSLKFWDLTTGGGATQRDQYSAIPTWVDPADATRKARIVFNAFDTIAREAFRIEASGTAPMIGFLGANAIARPTITGSRAGNAALASLLTQLVSFGLITDGTSA